MVSGDARIVCEENGWAPMPKCEGKPSVNVQPVLQILHLYPLVCWVLVLHITFLMIHGK